MTNIISVCTKHSLPVGSAHPNLPPTRLECNKPPAPICHGIPHLLDTQRGRLCLFFIWTVGDGARCLAAAECSGVTVPLMGHDERPPMKDEAWSVFGGGGMAGAQPDDRLPPEFTR